MEVYNIKLILVNVRELLPGRGLLLGDADLRQRRRSGSLTGPLLFLAGAAAFGLLHLLEQLAGLALGAQSRAGKRWAREKLSPNWSFCHCED